MRGLCGPRGTEYPSVMLRLYEPRCVPLEDDDPRLAGDVGCALDGVGVARGGATVTVTVTVGPGAAAGVVACPTRYPRIVKATRRHVPIAVILAAPRWPRRPVTSRFADGSLRSSMCQQAPSRDVRSKAGYRHGTYGPILPKLLNRAEPNDRRTAPRC